MFPLFLASIFISKNLSIYNSESKEYRFSNELKVESYLKEEFLFLLGFLFFFQTLYNGFNSITNTLLFYFFINFNYLNNYDIILFEIIKKDLGYYFTMKDILFINYILLSFFLSKLELIEIFILLFFQNYFNSILYFIENNSYFPLSLYYNMGIKKGKELLLEYKKRILDNFIYKKKDE